MELALVRLRTKWGLWVDEVRDALKSPKATVLLHVELQLSPDGKTLTLVAHSKAPAMTRDSRWLQLFRYAATEKQVWARIVPPHHKLGPPPPLTAVEMRGHMPPLGADEWEEALMGPRSDGVVDADVLRALRLFGTLLTMDRKLWGRQLVVQL